MGGPAPDGAPSEPDAEASTGRREVGAAVLLATSLVALIHLTPPSFFGGVDWLQLHLPARQYMRQALLAGHLPLWNPHVALGRPFLADIETAVFYPPNVLYLALDPSVAYALLTAAHASLGCWGMMQLGRHLRIDPWARWLCAALLVSSQAVVARLQAGQSHYGHAIYYLPLLLLLCARLVREATWRRVLGIALLLALQLLCGHPQIAWITWLGLATFCLGCTVPTREGLRRAGWAVGALLAAILFALALAAPTLLPFLELVGQGNRVAQTVESSGQDAMNAFHWSSLVVPDAGRAAFYWEFNLFTGVAAVIGGAGGLIACRREQAVRGLIAMGAVGGVLGTAGLTPAFALFFHVLPGTSVFRLHARAGLLLVIALVVGLGLLVSRRTPLRTAAWRTAVGALAASGLVLCYHAFAPPRLRDSTLAAGPRLAWIAISASALALAAARPGRTPWVQGAVIALALGDVAWALPATKRAWSWPVRTEGERGLHGALASAGLLAAGAAPPRVAVTPELARENAGSVNGWSSLGGYQAVSLARVWTFLHESLDIPFPRDKTFPSMDIYRRGPFPYDSMSLVAGIDLKTSRLVVRGDPDPRVYVATSARVVGRWQDAIALMKGGHDFHGTVLLESAPGVVLPEARPAPGQPTGARIVSFRPERIEIETDVASAGVLVVAEPWYPGWTARVDGARTPCVPANAWMRAVVLPAGRHRVVLDYESRWLWPGLLLSGATLLGLSILAWRSTPAATRLAGGPAAS
jgi:hypothetical protein